MESKQGRKGVMIEEEKMEIVAAYIQGVIGGVATGAYGNEGIYSAMIDLDSLFEHFTLRYPGIPFEALEKFTFEEPGIEGYFTK